MDQIFWFSFPHIFCSSQSCWWFEWRWMVRISCDDHFTEPSNFFSQYKAAVFSHDHRIDNDLFLDNYCSLLHWPSNFISGHIQNCHTTLVVVTAKLFSLSTLYSRLDFDVWCTFWYNKFTKHRKRKTGKYVDVYPNIWHKDSFHSRLFITLTFMIMRWISTWIIL